MFDRKQHKKTNRDLGDWVMSPALCNKAAALVRRGLYSSE